MTMRLPLIALAAAVLLLTGCSNPPPAPADAIEPTEPTVECLTVTDGAINALQALAKENVTIERATAVTDKPEGPWYVAAEFTIDYGFDDIETDTATWITRQDPTTATDAAYLSVDAVAAVVTDYLREPGASASDPGAELAQDCLQQ